MKSTIDRTKAHSAALSFRSAQAWTPSTGLAL